MTYMCKDESCEFDKQERKEGYCPECGNKLEKVGFRETMKISNSKRKYKDKIKAKKKEKEKEIKREAKLKAQQEELKKQKARQESLVWNPEEDNDPVPLPKGSLFSPNEGEAQIVSSIYDDMINLYQHEAGTKWMRIGTLLSFNATQQMIGAGFKAIIDQNKIIIKQNELIYRELKKLNSKR